MRSPVKAGAGCTIESMDAIDVDEIAEVNYFNDSTRGEHSSVEVRFKDGTVKSYSGPELQEVLSILNHWTPPTA